MNPLEVAVGGRTTSGPWQQDSFFTQYYAEHQICKADPAELRWGKGMRAAGSELGSLSEFDLPKQPLRHDLRNTGGARASPWGGIWELPWHCHDFIPRLIFGHALLLHFMPQSIELLPHIWAVLCLCALLMLCLLLGMPFLWLPLTLSSEFALHSMYSDKASALP